MTTTMKVMTKNLQPGMMVRLTSKIVREVSRISSSPYVNMKNDPIRYVYYTPDETCEWSDANSSNDLSEWDVVS